jgi:plasmid stabilization system protein ParE
VTTGLRLTTAARLDIVEAFDWCLERSPKAASGLLKELDAAMSLIAREPLQWPEVHPEVRGVIVKRFPYAVFFTIGRGEAVVIAVFHAKRDPQKWLTRS